MMRQEKVETFRTGRYNYVMVIIYSNYCISPFESYQVL